MKLHLQRDDAMRSMLLSTTAALLLLAGPTAFAEDMKMIGDIEIDVAEIASGMRVSELMDADIKNDEGETIGEVSDAIVSPSDKLTYAIIGVGGFLGLGERMVAVPVDMLQRGEEENELVLQGATKETLESMPEFKFES